MMAVARAGDLRPGSAVPEASPEALNEAMQACRPLVVRGLVADWPSVKAAARSPSALVDYLEAFDNGQTVEAFFGPPQIGGKYYYSSDMKGFNFERRRMRLLDALHAMLTAMEREDGSSVYVGSIPTEVFLPGFSADNPAQGPPPHVNPRIWIGTASNVSCHYDTLDNLACVAAGARRFTLYPPELIGSLYVGPIDNTMAGQPVSLAASAAPGEGDFPLFEQVRHQALTAELAPGDALYLPKLWWHQVEATAPFNAMVNFWWEGFGSGPDAPYAALLLAMIAISERPPAERQAWRAFFDHYVFRSAGHPLAHLPPEQHGILGPLRPSNYGRIRARVMQMLRGG